MAKSTLLDLMLLAVDIAVWSREVDSEQLVIQSAPGKGSGLGFEARAVKYHYCFIMPITKP